MPIYLYYKTLYPNILPRVTKLFFRKLLDRIGALQQVEEVNNQEVNNINNFSKDIYKSLLANEYTIDEFFEKNVSKAISL